MAAKTESSYRKIRAVVSRIPRGRAATAPVTTGFSA